MQLPENEWPAFCMGPVNIKIAAAETTVWSNVSEGKPEKNYWKAREKVKRLVIGHNSEGKKS